MSIITAPEFWSQKTVEHLERHYAARYVCEMPYLSHDTWREDPSLIFWNDVAHPQGSNYFAISRSGDDVVISDAFKTVQFPIIGIRADNGDIIYSHCRHHMNRSADGSVWIDGGMDYLRHGGQSDRIVYLRVVGDQVQIAFKDEYGDGTSA